MRTDSWQASPRPHSALQGDELAISAITMQPRYPAAPEPEPETEPETTEDDLMLAAHVQIKELEGLAQDRIKQHLPSPATMTEFDTNMEEVKTVANRFNRYSREEAPLPGNSPPCGVPAEGIVFLGVMAMFGGAYAIYRVWVRGNGSSSSS